MSWELFLAFALLWPHEAKPDDAATENAPLTLQIVQFSQKPKFVGLPKFCEPDDAEIIICEVTLIQGKARAKRALGGSALPKHFLLRLIKAHDFIRLHKASQILVSAKPFEDDGDKGYFAARWWAPNKAGEYCLDEQAIMELKVVTLFASARFETGTDGEAKRCIKL